ncbi:glycosyltransferase [Pseudomonadales bacterium]|nr:glycosyltransferase [Pseudomonadales bacterium]MDB4450891.1 glycosyltransferase [Pseudomonadales bacterium]
MKFKPYVEYLTLTFFLKWCRGIVGGLLSILAIGILFITRKQKGSLLLMKSIRISPHSFSTAALKKILPMDFGPYLQNDVLMEEACQRSIILSLPTTNNGKIKKGVLLITFTRTFAYYLNQPNFILFDKYFIFVLEPSWSGYADPEILSFIVRAEHCLVQATEQQDTTLLNALFLEGVATSFGASDWVNPDKFRPDNVVKQYDSIYVANMNPIKRVYRYIDAIERISQSWPEYKGCLVCAGWGGAKESIERYLASKNLSKNLVFIPGLEQDELIKIINQSKVNILLSLKEGSNRSLFESMFLDVPAICISENIGVNKSYINEFTGLLISDSFLEDALISMRENWISYRPRAWALKNISPNATTAKLANLLELKFGAICNSTLSVKSNNPEVEYLDEDIDHVEILTRLFSAIKESDEQIFWKHVEGTKLTRRKVDPNFSDR